MKGASVVPLILPHSQLFAAKAYVPQELNFYPKKGGKFLEKLLLSQWDV